MREKQTRLLRIVQLGISCVHDINKARIAALTEITRDNPERLLINFSPRADSPIKIIYGPRFSQRNPDYVFFLSSFSFVKIKSR